MKEHKPPKTKKSKTSFPRTITVPDIYGISAKIYQQTRTKGEGTYTSYLVAYSLLGKRKLESHSELADAEVAAEDAIKRIAEGKQAVLELSNQARDQYVRSQAIVGPLGIDIETACRECAEVRGILGGRGTPAEAARLFVKQHAKELPRISVAAAVKECLKQCRADGKSKGRMHQLEHYLNAFADSMKVEVTELTPGLVSQYLIGLAVSERTKKNARDSIGFFGRWLVLHGYLARGTDLVDGVQRYRMKTGEIHIFTTAELSKLIENVDEKVIPYLTIGAFAGLRQAEIQRLDWTEVDLEDGYIEVKAEKAKTDTRRLVPIKPNLKAWLTPLKKRSGHVCPLRNPIKPIYRAIKAINKAMPKGTSETEKMRWKKNALRHSCISYRVAECADVARVADESGNSPGIIKSNYLKRVKPEQAKEWFNVMPGESSAIPLPRTSASAPAN